MLGQDLEAGSWRQEAEMKTMMRQAWRLAVVVAVVGLMPGRAFAADKTHQQIMAELRMLQEQQQQLQQLLGGLGDTLRTLTTKIDEQSGATRKAFADQKLLVDNLGEGVRILREKADDTNVRLSSMTQELESLRQTIASIPAPAAVAPSVDPVTGEPLAAPPQPGTASVPNVSHKRVYDMSYSDYTAGQWDLAVKGFEEYIRSYPSSPLADDAQLNIGNAYYAAGRFKEAVSALLKVISDFPQSDSVSAAYYKLGKSYEELARVDDARKAYEAIIEKFPDSMDRSLAQQALERLKRKEDVG
jgi:tol-pal system protein YbgF